MIKATELMTGDYVRVNRPGLCIEEGTVVQILLVDSAESIVNFNLKGSAGCKPIDDDDYVGCIWLNYLDPIPLTEEILRKNGWEYHDENAMLFPQTWVGDGLILQGTDDCGYRIVVPSDYDDQDTTETSFVLLYVHELQHALRLRRIEKEIEL